MPPLFTDNRLRIILGTGCFILGIVNAVFYYRDLALVAQAQATIPEPKKVSQVAPSPSPISQPSPTVSSSHVASPPPSPIVTPKATPALKIAPSSSPSTAVAGVIGRVNITTATEAEFDTLPGIGPSKAKAIVEYRASKPFTKLEDLKEVTGIGDKTYEQLLPYIEL